MSEPADSPPTPASVRSEPPPQEVVPAGDAPPAEPSPPEEWNEDLYQAACTVLVEQETPASPLKGIGCLLISGLLFTLSFWFSMDVQAIGFLIPVLLMHETGHFLGMRAFGYRNLRMFFIPFFGAAVSGTKHAAPAWQQAVVLLLGPLPGIVLGLALQLWLHPTSGTWAGNLVLWLIILNGVNLLPVVPLDGGRLLDVLLFSRRPALALAFHLLAVLVLLALAYLFTEWVLGVVGGLMLLAAPARYRKAQCERAFSHNPLELPERLDELGDVQRRDLFGWVALQNPLANSPVVLAAAMRSLHEHMVARRPGMIVWCSLLLLYLGGIAGSVGTGLIAFEHNRQARIIASENNRQAWITVLVTRFEQTAREMDGLREQYRRLLDPKGRDKVEANKLQQEINRAWSNLIADWKKASLDAQKEARLRIVKNLPPGWFDDFTRLLKDVGYRQAE